MRYPASEGVADHVLSFGQHGERKTAIGHDRRCKGAITFHRNQHDGRFGGNRQHRRHGAAVD